MNEEKTGKEIKAAWLVVKQAIQNLYAAYESIPEDSEFCEQLVCLDGCSPDDLWGYKQAEDIDIVIENIDSCVYDCDEYGNAIDEYDEDDDDDEDDEEYNEDDA